MPPCARIDSAISLRMSSQMPIVFGRGEGLDLDGRVTDHGGGADHLVGRLVDLEAQLHAGDALDAQRPQVEPAVVVVDLGGVERSRDAAGVRGHRLGAVSTAP